MGNCLFNTFQCVWSFVMGSLRMILFFACLLLAFSQLVSLSIITGREDEDIDMVNRCMGGFLDCIFLLAISFLGCYGSFYKHEKSLKWVSRVS